MGLFGFGRKKKKQQDDERLAEAVDSRTEDVAVEDSEDDEQTEVLEGARTEVGVDYEGRGETVGPWDVDDANAPITTSTSHLAPTICHSCRASNCASRRTTPPMRLWGPR